MFWWKLYIDYIFSGEIFFKQEPEAALHNRNWAFEKEYTTQHRLKKQAQDGSKAAEAEEQEIASYDREDAERTG